MFPFQTKYRWAYISRPESYITEGHSTGPLEAYYSLLINDNIQYNLC